MRSLGSCGGFAAAVLLFVITCGDAAGAAECKSETIVADGPPAVSKDVGAYQTSLFAWQKAAAEKFGQEYAAWRIADARSVDCKQLETDSGARWVCKRSAHPCRDETTRIGDKAETSTCKTKATTSYGGRDGTEDGALSRAKIAWRTDVLTWYDRSWAAWESASGTDYDCWKMGEEYQCMTTGTPCRADASEKK